MLGSVLAPKYPLGRSSRGGSSHPPHLWASAEGARHRDRDLHFQAFSGDGDSCQEDAKTLTSQGKGELVGAGSGGRALWWKGHRPPEPPFPLLGQRLLWRDVGGSAMAGAEGQ